MENKAVLLNESDNIITVSQPVKKGDSVVYFKGAELQKIIATTDIPEWNKMAITKIKKGDSVIKYGEFIGRAIFDIESGEYTSHLNIESMPRDYSCTKHEEKII